jgi:hypothetical protein
LFKGRLRMKRLLRITELEERIAPVILGAGGLVVFPDANGDVTWIYYDGPEGSSVEVLDSLGGDIGSGDNIGDVTLSGADSTSELRIFSENDGGGDLLITGGIYAPGQDVGLINIGLPADETPNGDVILSNGFEIEVGGDLGTVIIDGQFDSDVGNHSITAAGDIGTFIAAGIHIDHTTGVVDVIAGGDGSGDISFIFAGGLYASSGYASPVAGTAMTGNDTIADDVGYGTDGSLTLKLTGTGAAGEYWAVPVFGGGCVLSYVEITSADSMLAIKASGDGGDVTQVEFDGSANAITLSGSADTDLWSVLADGTVGTIANKTMRGDIGYVNIGSGGGAGLIQTGRGGVFGSVFSGSGNDRRVFENSEYLTDDGSVVDGTIAKLQTSGILNTDVVAGGFGVVDVRTGLIRDSLLMTDGDVVQVTVLGLANSDLVAEGALDKLTVGSVGMEGSFVQGLGGIGAVAVKGVIHDSTISAQTENVLDQRIGAGIASVSADAVIESSIEAIDDIGSVKVKGAFWESDLDTRWWDDDLGAYVGGAIGSFQAGGVYNSGIEALDGIGSVKIGKGGMLYSSSVRTEGDLDSMLVQGDVDYTSVDVEGTAGKLSVLGVLSNDSAFDLGSAGTVTIKGDVHNSDIDIVGSAGKLSLGGIIGSSAHISAASMTSLSVNGMVASDGGTVIDVDTLTALTVKGDVYYAAIDFVTAGKLAFGDLSLVELTGQDVGQMTMGEATELTMTIGNELGSLKTKGGLLSGGIVVDGNAGALNIGGDLVDFEVELTGATADGIIVKGDLFEVDITVGEDGVTATACELISIGGSYMYSDIDTFGPIEKVSIKGMWLGSDMTAGADVGSLSVGKGISDCDIYSDYTIGPVTVGGHMSYCWILCDGGIGNVTVKGNILNARIEANLYDGGGDPLASSVGNVTAAKIWDTRIESTGDVGMVTSKGLIAGSDITAVGVDAFGGGDPVGGGSIAGIKASGLMNTDISSWGDMGKMTLGGYGVSADSDIEILHTSGDFAGLTTRGIMHGEITLAGDLTGSVLTGGADAIEEGDVFYFVDANGNRTGGFVTVDGSVASGVVVS